MLRPSALVACSIAPNPTSQHPGLEPTAAWLGIIANPFSGCGRTARRVEELHAALVRLGVPVRVATTLEERRALVEASTNHPECCRALVAVGGDGTVSALVNERPTCPIAVMPSGTENLFARHFGFGVRSRSLAEAIARGQSRLVDVGIANDRRFVLMAGFGFDADVVTRHHRSRVRSSGLPRPTSRAAYVEPILRSSFEYPFPEIAVSVAGEVPETIVGTTVLLFNLPRYALGLPFAPQARDDDGLLDLVVFRKPGPLHALRYLWLVFRGLHLSGRGVTHRRVRSVTVSASAPVPVQLDGDPAGVLNAGPEQPWTLKVIPSALRVLSMP